MDIRIKEGRNEDQQKGSKQRAPFFGEASLGESLQLRFRHVQIFVSHVNKNVR